MTGESTCWCAPSETSILKSGSESASDLASSSLCLFHLPHLATRPTGVKKMTPGWPRSHLRCLRAIINQLVRYFVLTHSPCPERTFYRSRVGMRSIRVFIANCSVFECGLTGASASGDAFRTPPGSPRADPRYELQDAPESAARVSERRALHQLDDWSSLADHELDNLTRTYDV